MLPELRDAAALGGRTEGEAVNNQPGGLPPTIPTATDPRADDTATAPNGMAATLSGYAVVVTVPADPEPRTRRRLYLSLHSAQKAVQRAEARGLDAQLVLVRMVPEGVGT